MACGLALPFPCLVAWLLRVTMRVDAALRPNWLRRYDVVGNTEHRPDDCLLPPGGKTIRRSLPPPPPVSLVALVSLSLILKSSQIKTRIERKDSLPTPKEAEASGRQRSPAVACHGLPSPRSRAGVAGDRWAGGRALASLATAGDRWREDRLERKRKKYHRRQGNRSLIKRCSVIRPY